MKNKKKLLMMLFVLCAAYFSLHGISYERAILKNTLEVCCDLQSCNGKWCELSAMVEHDPNGTWVTNCWDCVDYWGGEIWCRTEESTLEYCEYWGEGDIRNCPEPVDPPQLSASLSGPSILDIPQKEYTYSVTFSSSVTGGETPYTYSWYFKGATGSSSSFTYTYGYTTPQTQTVYLTVTSNDGQSINLTKTVQFRNDM